MSEIEHPKLYLPAISYANRAAAVQALIRSFEEAVRAHCEKECRVEIVDVVEEPERAMQQIFVIPMVVKEPPEPQPGVWISERRLPCLDIARFIGRRAGAEMKSIYSKCLLVGGLRGTGTGSMTPREGWSNRAARISLAGDRVTAIFAIE